jgi:6-phosphogluconate dehydrogenase
MRPRVSGIQYISKIGKMLTLNLSAGKPIEGAHSIEEFVAKLKKPRRMMLLVMAGKPVDDFIETLLKAGVEKGDIIIDGGNSHFPDTNRRTKYLAEKGIRFVGSGVSGGEEGARYGPSLMPGGNEEAWPYIKDVFQGIAAKSDGEPCCDWVGDEGAGHYVKMVHNGIEYGDMQLISEVWLFWFDSIAYLLIAIGLRYHEAWSWSVKQGDWRCFHQVEQGRS